MAKFWMMDIKIISLQEIFKDFYECHIKPDLLLIYKYNNNILELHLYNIGSHSNLFG